MKNTKNIKAYIPVKFNSTIKGYWKDNKGQVYIDNIIIQTCTGLQFERIKANLFKQGEQAIFYIQDDIAYIQGKDTLERLTRNIIIENIQDKDIQGLLNKYSGFTYFKTEKQAHIWQK
jgi:hypothetical protein